MDSVDAQRVRIHHDQAEVGFVTADDEGLKPLRPIDEIGQRVAKMLLGVGHFEGIDFGDRLTVPSIKIVPAMPALNRDHGWFR